VQRYGDLKVGDKCPKCGAIITSLSVKTIKGKEYLYAYHGDRSCYLGPATAQARRAPRRATREAPREGTSPPAPVVPHGEFARAAPARTPDVASQAPRLDALLAELRGLNARLDALSETIIDLFEDIKQRDQPKAEEAGTSLIRTVTRSDSRRGKVYLPKEWIGRKVKVTLIE